MRIAVLGATGLVGRAMLRRLEDRGLLDESPRLLASARSAGSTLTVAGVETVVEDVATADLAGLDAALFSVGGGVSRDWAPRFADEGAVVIDNSSAWRMDPVVPLVVPEINADVLPDGPGVVANPNCSTIQIVMALAPLHRAFGLRGFHAATYQSVSGAGTAARRALLDQLAAGRPADLDAEVGPLGAAAPFSRPVAYDVVPEIGAPLPDGSFEEEAKVVRESRKILGLPDLRVSCLAVRVPSWNGHGAAVRAEFAEPLDRTAVLHVLREFPGLCVADGPHGYATPRESSGRDEVFVGRVRLDPDDPRTVTLWTAADNLLKGAALNAVQIVETLRARGTLR